MGISRRALIAAIPLLGCAGQADARAATLHVAPDGEGDGLSWSTAAPLNDLGDLLVQLEPGGEILIAADRGEYQLTGQIDIASGGKAGHEIRVRGVNSSTGAAMPAVIRGDRSETDEGFEGFRLLRGASHLRFSHFNFRDIGNGAFRIAAPVANIGIEDCTFENIYRFLENTAGDGEGHATLRGFTVRRCRGSRVERGFLRIRYNSRDGLIEDCAAQGLPNEGGRIPAGCAIDDRAANITYRRCVMEGFQQWRGGDYWNGDGFSDEPGNRGIRYEACEARGSTDGGFDCKSEGVVLQNCIAADNKRNFRIWSQRARLEHCTSRQPNFRGRDVENANSSHIWIGAEANTQIVISDLTIQDTDATQIIEFDHDDARIQIRDVRIESPRVNWGLAEDRIRAGMLSGEQR